jgi:hypothetical protein
MLLSRFYLLGSIETLRNRSNVLSVRELLDNGAELDRGLKPCKYKYAMKRILEKKVKMEKRRFY